MASRHGLSEAADRLLRAAIAHPGTPASKLPALARLGSHQAQRARQELVEANLAREHRIQLNATGRAAVILEPLPRAFDAVGLPQPTGGPS